MDIQFEGWARKHGRLSIASFDLTTRLRSAWHRLLKGRAADRSLRRRRGRRTITVNRHTNVRLGGDYQAMVTLSKKEIARLYYLTHQRK